MWCHILLYLASLVVGGVRCQQDCGALIFATRYAFDAQSVTVCVSLLSDSSRRSFVLQHVQPRSEGNFEIVEGNSSLFTTSVCSDDDRDTFEIEPVPDLNQRGVLVIVYTPMNGEAITIFFAYSPPSIFFNGDPSGPNEVSASSNINFAFQSSGINEQISVTVCEMSDSGEVLESTDLTAQDTLRPNTSCIAPQSGSSTAFEIPVRLVDTPTHPSSQRQIFVTAGTCGQDHPLMSGIVNVTIVTDVTNSPTTVPPEETTTEPGGTTEQSDDVVAIAVGIVLGVLAVVVIVVVVVIVAAVCVSKRHKRVDNGSGANDLALNGIEDVDSKLNDEKLIEDNNREVSVEGSSRLVDRSSAVTSNGAAMSGQDRYVTFPLSVKPPPTPDPTTVSGVVFVSAGDTTNYRELEEELLSLHECERLQPVARADGQPLSLEDYWRRITTVLREGKSLVYVVWSGALESLNGSCIPPIRKILQFFTSRQSQKNMHRLVLVQLGSKGTVHQIVAERGVTFVFWNQRADDHDFGAKACATHVHEVVRTRLKCGVQPQAGKSVVEKSYVKELHDQKLLGHDQTDPGSKVKFTISSSPKGSQSQLSDHDPNANPDQPASSLKSNEDLLREMKDLSHKMDQHQEENREHFSNLSEQVGHVAKQVDHNNLKQSDIVHADPSHPPQPHT